MATRGVPANTRIAYFHSPAKVNLTLRVLGRRPDGYHEIESVMVPVSLLDDIKISVRPVSSRRPSIRCHVCGPETVPGGPTNLASRAAKKVLDNTGIRADVDIRLFKRIPAGAGLGGGSGNAAAVLRVLPALIGRSVSKRVLEQLAVEIGADVPFFLRCRPVLARGIGERLSSIEAFPTLQTVVVVPRRAVSTVWAYDEGLPRRCKEPFKADSKHEAPSERLRFELESLSSRVFNDFECGVSDEVDEIRREKRTLQRHGAKAVVMSGTGSAVVGIFSTRAEAEDIAATLVGEGKRAYPAQSLSSWPRARRA